MKTRAITGFFFVLILIGAVLFSPYVFVPFFILIGIGSVFEFYKMVETEEIKPLNGLGTLMAAVFLSIWGLSLLRICASDWLLWSAIAFFLVYIVVLFKPVVSSVIQTMAFTLFGWFYVAIPFAFFIGLGFMQSAYDAYVPMGFLVLLWTNDTGAYLAGKTFGKRKLFERISPNKTWEGFVGGVLLALAIAFVLAHYFDSLLLWQWVIMALTIGIFGTLGDLVESMLKRNSGVKDSGTILPGHGGFLDRFDGLLMAAPLVYLFLKFF